MKKNILGFLMFALLSSFSLLAKSASFDAPSVTFNFCCRYSTDPNVYRSGYVTGNFPLSLGNTSTSSSVCGTTNTKYNTTLLSTKPSGFSQSCIDRMYVYQTFPDNPYTCPANSTVNNNKCEPNAGFSAVYNNGSWSVVPAGSECAQGSVYNSSTGTCSAPPTCTYPQFLGSDNTCQDPAPCVEGKITKSVITNYPPNPICVDGCNHNLIAPDFIKGLISPSGSKTSCYKNLNDTNNQEHCDVILKQTGEGCFIPYNPTNLFNGTSTGFKSEPQSKPLNNDGSVNYDGNPNTSGANEPGSPTSGKNIDGTIDTDGDPSTTGTNQTGDGSPDGQPNPDPNNDHECPTSTTWSDESEQCEPIPQAECDPTQQTCKTECEAGYTFDTSSDSCIPTESCDNNINSCISTEDEQNLTKLKTDSDGMMAEITKAMDEFDLLSYPTWFPQFQKTNCQPLQGQIYGKTITWDFCPYVSMLNEIIGWLMSLFTLWTVVQIGIKKD